MNIHQVKTYKLSDTNARYICMYVYMCLCVSACAHVCAEQSRNLLGYTRFTEIYISSSEKPGDEGIFVFLKILRLVAIIKNISVEDYFGDIPN